MEGISFVINHQTSVSSRRALTVLSESRYLLQGTFEDPESGTTHCMVIPLAFERPADFKHEVLKKIGTSMSLSRWLTPYSWDADVWCCPHCHQYLASFSIACRHAILPAGVTRVSAHQACADLGSDCHELCEARRLARWTSLPSFSQRRRAVLWSSRCERALRQVAKLDNILLSILQPAVEVYLCPFCPAILGCRDCLMIHLSLREEGLCEDWLPEIGEFLLRTFLRKPSYVELPITYRPLAEAHCGPLVPHEERFAVCSVHSSFKCYRALSNWLSLGYSLLIQHYATRSSLLAVSFLMLRMDCQQKAPTIGTLIASFIGAPGAGAFLTDFSAAVVSHRQIKRAPLRHPRCEASIDCVFRATACCPSCQILACSQHFNYDASFAHTCAVCHTTLQMIAWDGSRLLCRECCMAAPTKASAIGHYRRVHASSSMHSID